MHQARLPGGRNSGRCDRGRHARLRAVHQRIRRRVLSDRKGLQARVGECSGGSRIHPRAVHRQGGQEGRDSRGQRDDRRLFREGDAVRLRRGYFRSGLFR